MAHQKISEREERLKKLEELKKLGVNPFPSKTNRTHNIGQILAEFEVLERGKAEVFIVGRIRSMRGHGNLTFAHLEDASGRIQIAVSKKELNKITPPTPPLSNGGNLKTSLLYKEGLGEVKKNPPGPLYTKGVFSNPYKIFTNFIDVGDFLEARGICFKTHKGEKSLIVKEWKLLSKAVRPLPDKWYGFKDEEEKFRKRYLDILFNPEVREMIERKAIFWNAVREFMMRRGFLEVETPVLENTTGGADARPFITHHNALDIDVYLRISMGELWQKRLMVAGFEKTFEIGRQFRNEGMDIEHLQDYTQMEFYWAYADYEDSMKLVEELFKHTAQKTFSTLKFGIGKFKVDLGKKWETYDYQKTIKKFTGLDILKADIKQIEIKLKKLEVEYDKKGFNITRAIDNLWKYCRKQLEGPGFLIGMPVEVSPLAKRDEKNPRLVQRFQPIVAGSELGNGYSELNDPLDQAQRFAAQAKLREAGDEEAQMFDHKFVEALEYGMPPTCGFGMSERVFAVLMNKPTRECQTFPLMKPKSYNT